MSKKISFSLSEDSIDKAIQELQGYIDSLQQKTDRLREKIAEAIQWSAQDGFQSAIADDIFRGGERKTADVQVTVQEEGDVTIVIANGEDAVFIEFGAGVYHNGGVGSSPHPKGQEMGYTIGEYGKGQGKKYTWALPGSTSDDPILTHGTPAAMPMYRGVQEAVAVMVDFAREVFG